MVRPTNILQLRLFLFLVPTVFFVIVDNVNWGERKRLVKHARDPSEVSSIPKRIRYMKNPLPAGTYIGSFDPPINGYFRIEVIDDNAIPRLSFEGYFLEFISNTILPADMEKAEYRVYGYQALYSPGERLGNRSSLEVNRGATYTMKVEYKPIQSTGGMKGRVVIEVSPESL